MSLVVKINNMKKLPSEIFEGKDSSLRKTFESACDVSCNHIMVDTGKYERECRFCKLKELTAK